MAVIEQRDIKRRRVVCHISTAGVDDSGGTQINSHKADVNADAI